VERVADDGAVDKDATEASFCPCLGGEWNEAEPREPKERSARVPADSSVPFPMSVTLHKVNILFRARRVC
jgi:hypothetical protein